MKLIINGIHYKTMDKKYAGVADIGLCLDDFEHKRLSVTEVECLDIALLNKTFSEQFAYFIENIKVSEPLNRQ